MGKNDQNFISALETLGYKKNLRVEINTTFIKSITPNTSEGICLFVNKEGKIVFAEELLGDYTGRITRTFRKVIRYINNITLSDNNKASILSGPTEAQ